MSLGEYIGAGASTTKLLLHLNGNSTDNSGNGNNGTDTNITYIDGKFGKCASFNGSNSGINLGNPTSLTGINGTQTFFIRAFVYISEVPANDTRRIILRQGAEATSTWGLSVYGMGSTARIEFRTSPVGGNGRSQYSNGSLSLNTWHEVVAWCIGGTANANIFIDGVKQTLSLSDPANSVYLFNASTANIYIGRDSSGNYYKGNIDELLVEVGSWSDEKIKKQHTYSKGRFGII